MIPFADRAIPWRLIGIGLAALVLGAALLWVGHRVRVSYEAEIRADQAEAALKEEREQNAVNIRAIAQDIADNERDRGYLARRFDAIDQRFDGLQLSLLEPAKLIQSTEVPGAPCPRVGLSPMAVSVYNAAATEAGSAEAETRRSNGAVPGPAVHDPPGDR